jgi:hypothetical protein
MTTRRITPAAQLRQRVLAIYCDALIAWSHGSPIDTAAVHGEIDALINAAFADQARQLEDRRRRAVSFRRRR